MGHKYSWMFALTLLQFFISIKDIILTINLPYASLKNKKN